MAYVLTYSYMHEINEYAVVSVISVFGLKTSVLYLARQIVIKGIYFHLYLEN